MNERSSDNLLGQTSALMMVVREMLARLPEEEVKNIRASVEQRLAKHAEHAANIPDIIAGANDMMRRLFIDDLRTVPAR